jgi:hypothetical protein
VPVVCAARAPWVVVLSIFSGGVGVMGPRWLRLGVAVCVCTLVCVFGVGVGSAWAAGSFFFGPPGEEAGQISLKGATAAAGMAVDRKTGDVLVGDGNNNRVDEFTESGEFVLAWGWGVANGADELQTCTTSCQQGIEGTAKFCLLSGVAVDNEPGSGSYGDVYVVNSCGHDVDKFDSSGKFLLAFGGHVNEAKDGSALATEAEKNVCIAGEKCIGGTPGVGDGEFEWNSIHHSYIAVGPGGLVYVGDKARVQMFESSGEWKENISLSALSSEGTVTAFAVNAAGDVFVKDEGVSGVRELESSLFLESPVVLDEGSEIVESIALDSAGDVFVSENNIRHTEEEPCTCDFLEYGPSGQELADFGGGTLVYMTSGMAFDDALGELLVYGTDAIESAALKEKPDSEYGHYGVWAFTAPLAGPLVEPPSSEKATPKARGHATLEAVVNPEGHETSYRFEYVDETHFVADGYADATITTPAPVGSGFVDQPVSASLTGLIPGATYHFRVVVTDSLGHVVSGPDRSFEETPAAIVEGPGATNVTSDSVTLEAKIDPLGANTSYRLEYGTNTAYGHVLSGNVGEGMGYVPVGYHLQGLESGVTYHYRLVTNSEAGVVESADRTFVTQVAGGALVLPDGRAWELVSPPNKTGALIQDIEIAQAADDGSGIVYSAGEPLGEGIVGHFGRNVRGPFSSATILSRRGAHGWDTRDISAKQTPFPEGDSAVDLFSASENFYDFTPDLALGVFEPIGGLTPQSERVSEDTIYLRNNVSEAYEPVVSSADVPPGTKFGPPTEEEMEFVAATPDLSHILFTTSDSLTPEAVNGSGERNLYEWSDGHLKLVNFLPDGTTQPGVEFGTSNGSQELAGDSGNNPDAMSSDGRWIVFRYEGNNSYYVRDMVGEKTVAFGRAHGNTVFLSMSRDGSKVFYLEPEPTADGGKQDLEFEGELYVVDPVTGAKIDLTADHLDGEHSADVENTLVGTSEDGRSVYFVARGVLAAGAIKGENNLYLAHEDVGGWSIGLVATLSSEDQRDWQPRSSGQQLTFITSRVSPNGRFVTFMSNNPLTGYDNHDAISGEPDEEVYLYDAVAKRLVCASCNPSGARPVGVHDQGQSHLLMDENESWSGTEEEATGNGVRGHWIAGIIQPGWHVEESVADYQPRYLSDSGRLFFDSSDALVPQDTNGLADVYEYEPVASGETVASDDCTTASATFSERSDGCVSLISSGQSSQESEFFDASESGDDAFFVTASKLVNEDYDDSYDLYDAHVCSSELPCPSLSVSPPLCTSGDSCKTAPSPQPEIFGPAPSATFSGAGNVIEEKQRVVKHKSKKKAKSKRKTKKKKAEKAKRARSFAGSRRVRTSRRGG